MSSFDESSFHVHIEENIDDDFNDHNDKIGRTKPRLVKGDVCKLFCRGDKCSKCVWLGQYSGIEAAISGLYSSWVTDNILAMARPNNKALKNGMLEEFQKKEIKTVINMQISGEHAYCGLGNDPESGFSYSPEMFMNSSIDYCNYPCEDFGVISIEHLLDIVKFFQHRLSHGKVAVHCHAGLGRTGIVVACLLIYNNRMSGEAAVNYVRQKRPKSIQNTVQVDQVLNFAKYLQPLRQICYIKSDNMYRFSVKEHVLRQRNFIHGHEASLLQFVPKVLFVCFKRLSDLSNQKNRSKNFETSSTSSDQTSVVDAPQTYSLKQETFLKWFRRISKYFANPISERKIKKLSQFFATPYEDIRIVQGLKKRLNSTNEVWTELRETNDIHLICQLICDWLKDLKFPLLRTQDLNILSLDDSKDMLESLLSLEPYVSRTLTLILLFLNQITSTDIKDRYVENICRMLYQLITHKYPEPNPNKREKFVVTRYFSQSILSHKYVYHLERVQHDFIRNLMET